MSAVSAAGWCEVPLGEVVTLHYGKALDKGDRDPNGSVPVYGANGVKDRSEKWLATGPSLIVGRKGSAGEITREDGRFWPLDVSYYTSHDSSRVDFDFLQYALTTLDLPSMARGVKPGINRNDVYGVRIALPRLDEQKRIVAVLDHAFAALDRARAHAEANLADAQRLFGLEVDRMRRSPAPSWPVVKLEKLAAVISGQHILAGEYNSEKRGIGYLTGPSDFGVKGPIVSKWTEHPKRTAIRGDILITVKGSGVGSLNIMVEDELAIRTKPNLREFIYLTLEASYQHFQGLANGAAIPGLSRSDVLDFELAMPTSAELPLLLSRLRTLRTNSDRLAQCYSDRLTDLANLRQSLLQKAFSGQLT